jgi:shikimate kinase
MGAGKTTIGRRIAHRLGLPFKDADAEIEQAAGCTIAEIFDRFGEAGFRDGERRVLRRLLTEEGQLVIATGGGAFIDLETRALILSTATSVWLKASLDTLAQRTARRQTRPLLLAGNPREILGDLMAKRDPFYAEADVTVESDGRTHEETVSAVLAALGVEDRLHRQEEMLP